MAGIQEAANWTVDRLTDAVRQVASNAVTEKAKLLANRSRIAALFRALRALPMSPARDKALEDAGRISKRVAQQFLDWQGFVSAWNGTLQKVNGFLRGIGLKSMEGAELSGLGAVPLVPLAIAAAVIAAAGAVVAMSLSNRSVGAALSLQEGAYQDMLSGRITPQQYQQVSDNINANLKAAADAARAGSLQGAIQAVVPLALLAALIFFGPQLMRMFSSRRAAA